MKMFFSIREFSDLATLETCTKVGMDMNIGKTKVVIFSFKRKSTPPTIKFNNKPLAIIQI